MGNISLTTSPRTVVRKRKEKRKKKNSVMCGIAVVLMMKQALTSNPLVPFLCFSQSHKMKSVGWCQQVQVRGMMPTAVGISQHRSSAPIAWDSGPGHSLAEVEEVRTSRKFSKLLLSQVNNNKRSDPLSAAACSQDITTPYDQTLGQP
jgi:hypothetical protein